MTTLSEFFTDHYQPERPIRKSSARQFRLAISSLERWHGGPVPLRDLSDKLANLWLIAEEQKCSPATVKGKRTHVLCVWRYAAEEHGLCDPPRRVRKVIVPRQTPDAWTHEELARMVEAARQIPGKYPSGIKRADWWELFIRADYDTGLRLSDLLSLPVDVVRMQTFSVCQSKTATPLIRRLSPATIAVALRTAGIARELLLPWNYRRETLWRHWKRYVLTPAGIDPSRRHGPQKLRRTSASHLESIRPGSAQAHLGHGTPGLAGKHYLDPRVVSAEPPLPPEWDGWKFRK